MPRFQLLFLASIFFANVVNAAHHGDGPPNLCHQYYPDIPGEVLLENDKLVVQRFIVEPGQWEGVHRHPSNQLFIHIKGGQWVSRFNDVRKPIEALDGEIGWFEKGFELHPEIEHESGNIGKEPIELLWIALKPGCLEESPEGNAKESFELFKEETY